MKNVLERKDGTSIICTQLFQVPHITHLKTKLVSFGVASTLIVLGLFLMFLI